MRYVLSKVEAVKFWFIISRPKKERKERKNKRKKERKEDELSKVVATTTFLFKDPLFRVFSATLQQNASNNNKLHLLRDLYNLH